MGSVGERSARTTSVYHTYRRGGSWVWLPAAGFVAAESVVMWIVDSVALLMDMSIPHLPIAVLGTLVWMVLVGLALFYRFGMGRLARRRLELDAERRSVRDASGETSLVGASAVEVKFRWLWGAQVVVKDAAGGVQWTASGLWYSQAKAFALDLAQMLSLPSPSGEPSMRKPVSPGRFDRAVCNQDRDSIRIGVWSRPVYSLLVLLPALAMTLFIAPMLLEGFAGMFVGELHFFALLALVGALANGLPRWRELEIRDDRLVVREGWLLRRVRTLPLSSVAPPRLVCDKGLLPTLVVRTHDGQHVEWVNRSEGVLRWVQQWIEHAQSLGVPAPPAPPAALLALQKASS